MKLDYRLTLLLTAVAATLVALAFVWIALDTDLAHARAQPCLLYTSPSPRD